MSFNKHGNIKQTVKYKILFKEKTGRNALVISEMFPLINFEIIASHLLNLKTFFRRDEVFAQTNVRFLNCFL